MHATSLTSAASLAICLAFLTSLGSVASESIVRLFLPKGYLPPGLFSGFERTNQCRVVTFEFEESEEMLRAFREKGAGMCDALVATDYTIPALVAGNYLAALPAGELPNGQTVDPALRRLSFDPENRYSLPFQFGTVGILLRTTNGLPRKKSWSFLFDSSPDAGPVVLIDSMRDTLGAALKFTGAGFNSRDAEEIRRARDLILPAVRRGATLSNSFEAKQAVLNRKAAAAMVYSGEGVRAMAADPQLTYFIPREGSEWWVDNLALSREAREVRLALKLMNFLLDADVNATISQFAQTSTPLLPSRAKIDPKLLNNPAVYPTAETRGKLELLSDAGPEAKLYEGAWREIKSAR